MGSIRLQGKKGAILAVSVTLGMILSYLEALIPMFSGVPGMKCGFSNILIVFLLYRYGPKESGTVNLLRILLTAVLFTNPFSLVYSLAGAVFSLAGMSVLKRCGIFSVFGVSMAGGVFHNLGQILIAVFLVENYRVFFYLPVLMISGCITGLIVGFLSSRLLNRVKI